MAREAIAVGLDLVRWDQEMGERIRHPTVFGELIPALAGLPEHLQQSERVFGTICVISYLLDSVEPANTWRAGVEALVATSFPSGPHRRVTEMGFPGLAPGSPALP